VQLNLHAYEGNSGSAKITHELNKCDLESILAESLVSNAAIGHSKRHSTSSNFTIPTQRFHTPSQNAHANLQIQSGSKALTIQILIQECLHHLAHLLRVLIHLALSLILSNSSQGSEKPHLFQFPCQLEEIFCCPNLSTRFRQPCL
jgi:hypothetical protein